MSSVVARHKGLKNMTNDEYMSFQSNWKRLLNDQQHDLEIIVYAVRNTIEVRIRFRRLSKYSSSTDFMLQFCFCFPPILSGMESLKTRRLPICSKNSNSL